MDLIAPVGSGKNLHIQEVRQIPALYFGIAQLDFIFFLVILDLRKLPSKKSSTNLLANLCCAHAFNHSSLAVDGQRYFRIGQIHIHFQFFHTRCLNRIQVIF